MEKDFSWLTFGNFVQELKREITQPLTERQMMGRIVAVVCRYDEGFKELVEYQKTRGG